MRLRHPLGFDDNFEGPIIRKHGKVNAWLLAGLLVLSGQYWRYYCGVNATWKGVVQELV